MITDREQELAELRDLADRQEPALCLLYGRRRVGKTFLLRHAWENRRSLYFLAADTTPAMNRRELVAEAGGDPNDHPTWRSALRLLGELAEQAPLVVVLDEFQYLMGGDDDIVSQLAAVWDGVVEARRLPLTLVLSGSAVSTMAELRGEGKGAPLHGRLAWAARLTPFDYRDAGRMVSTDGARPPREQARIYGVFGGMPRYLAAVRPDEPLDSAVARAMLSPRGQVHLQIATLIEQERGIRDPADYRAVLAAVASGRTDTNEIAAAAGLGERPYVVRRALEILEALDLVRRDRSFDAAGNAPYRHRVADPAVRFWYRFVHPNRARLEMESAEAVWVDAVEPHLDGYMGPILEDIARQGYRRLHRQLGLPAAQHWASWAGTDRARRDIEIDIVARLADGRILTGEVKWSSRPTDETLHYVLERDLDDLARSGRRWAHQALDPQGSAGRLYVSAAGFTPRFRDLAAERSADDDPSRIHLLSLEDLYA